MLENLKTKMKENQKELITYGIMLLFTMIVFGGFLLMHYATDTYNIMNVGYQTYAINWSLTDGRVFMALIGLLAGLLHLPITGYVIILLVVALAISCGTVMCLKNIIEDFRRPKNKWMEIAVLIISYMTIFNFMYIENMYFVECAVMAMSVLFYLLAAKNLVNKNGHYLWKTVGFMLLGVVSYQGTIGAFFAFLFLFTLLKNGKNVKEIAKDIGLSIIIGIIAVGFNVVVVKIVESIFHTTQTRIGTFSQILDNLKFILTHVWVILTETCGLFPKYLYLIFVGILFAVTIVYAIRKKEYYHIAKIMLLILACVVTGFLVYLMTLTSFYTGRLRFTIGATVGIMAIYLYCATDIFKERDIFYYLLVVILGTYFAFNIYNYCSLIYQHRKVNEMEKAEAEQIVQYLEEFEKDNQMEVNTVAIFIVPNRATKTYYENTKNRCVLTYSAFKSDWSIEGALKFYTGRDFERIEPDKIMQRTYERKKVEEKEYMCINDTLCINAFMF